MGKGGMASIAAIIVAAGRGERAGGAPKQLRDLAGRPALAWSLARFAEHADRLVVVTPPDLAAAVRKLAPDATIVDGGDTRTASVRAGLEALAADPPDLALVHDAARPLVSGAVIARVIEALKVAEGAAPVVKPADALKRVSDGDQIEEDVARDHVRAVQTPQGFRYAPLLAAYRALPAGAALPDDVAVARGAGIAVAAVEGDPDNLKVTYPEDFARAERLLAKPVQRVATGTGFDAHRLAAGDGLTLCGVRIACDLALVGFSDADAGFHAVVDAILGALGEGDIGAHFPPGDARWRAAPSRLFVEDAARRVAARGAEIAHVDLTLICERPKIAPHRAAMRAALAAALSVDDTSVSVKATTTEGMGFTGRGEGVAAQAVATLVWR